MKNVLLLPTKMERLRKAIIVQARDIIIPFTIRRKENEKYWIRAEELKFDAHMKISELVLEYYQGPLPTERRLYIQKVIEIHDAIRFITSDLCKSIGFKFDEYITRIMIENYATKLADVILEYVSTEEFLKTHKLI